MDSRNRAEGFFDVIRRVSQRGLLVGGGGFCIDCFCSGLGGRHGWRRRGDGNRNGSTRCCCCCACCAGSGEQGQLLLHDQHLLLDNVLDETAAGNRHCTWRR